MIKLTSSEYYVVYCIGSIGNNNAKMSSIFWIEGEWHVEQQSIYLFKQYFILFIFYHVI